MLKTIKELKISLDSKVEITRIGHSRSVSIIQSLDPITIKQLQPRKLEDSDYVINIREKYEERISELETENKNLKSI